jgi:hypothetical protein
MRIFDLITTPKPSREISEAHLTAEEKYELRLKEEMSSQRDTDDRSKNVTN